jgi:hypothetical protein
MWVLGGFLVSCTALLVVSWLLTMWPVYVRPNSRPGVPVKDYIIQSSEFLICAFALVHLSIGAWRERRPRAAVALAALALVFLLNIAFVATARSTFVIFVVLLVVVALQRFDGRGRLPCWLRARSSPAWPGPHPQTCVRAFSRSRRRFASIRPRMD